MIEEIHLEYPGEERQDTETFNIVEMGLFLEKYSGNPNVASTYLLNNEVPDSVVERVLLHPELRRSTKTNK